MNNNPLRPLFWVATGIGLLFLFSFMPATSSLSSQSPYSLTPPPPIPTLPCCALALPICHESSVYTITNPSSYRTTTTHVFYVEKYPPSGSIIHEFVDRFESLESKVYHLDVISGLLNGFQGTATILCDHRVTGTSSDNCSPKIHDVAVVEVRLGDAWPVNKAFPGYALLHKVNVAKSA